LTMFFIARLTHRVPETPMPRSWLLPRLSARMKHLWVVPLFLRVSMYSQGLGQFSAFRHRPGNRWCGCSCDEYACFNHGKLIQHDEGLVRDVVGVKFVREPPCCRWLLRSLCSSTWRNSTVRIAGPKPLYMKLLGKGGVFFLSVSSYSRFLCILDANFSFYS
jgi:hypothetical protein